MRHALMAGIAAVALALAIGALFATWETNPPNSAGLPGSAMEEGRASTTGEPARVLPPG